MWCTERKRQRAAVTLGLASAFTLLTSLVGSAAAADTTPPNLKVSGKAAWRVDARALGEGYELNALLSDEVGRPLPQAEVRVRTVSAGSASTLRRCGATRSDRQGEMLLATDNSGRVCVTVSGAPTESVELSFHDPRGYFERTSRVVPLPESVAASFEVGFDPLVTDLSLDQPSQELGVVARVTGGRAAPEAAELVVSLDADGKERELSRAPLDGLGEVHRLTLMSAHLGLPGPARLIVRMVDGQGQELSRATTAVMRTVTVSLRLPEGADGGIEPGAAVSVLAASALGPAPSGIVEAQSRGLSVAAAPVRGGAAQVTLPASTPSGLLAGAVELEYVGPGAGWLSGPRLELRVRPPGPSYARSLLWIAAAALAAAAVVLSWRRPARPRPQPAVPPPRPRASVEVLETFGAGGGYRGVVRDAHEGFGISPAVINFIGAGPNRPVLLQVRTNSQGAFQVENAQLPKDAHVEVSAPFHATLIAPLPVPGVIELSLLSRRRALMERLVRWAERRGRPWTAPAGEPTPHHIASVAAAEAQPQVERWARHVENLAFGPTPPDAAAEQAAGVLEDPTVRQDSGID